MNCRVTIELSENISRTSTIRVENTLDIEGESFEDIKAKVNACIEELSKNLQDIGIKIQKNRIKFK